MDPFPAFHKYIALASQGSIGSNPADADFIIIIIIIEFFLPAFYANALKSCEQNWKGLLLITFKFSSL